MPDSLPLVPMFFVAGTMKGATTRLYDIITSHPKVVAATNKEIHYFSLYYYRPLEWYLSHFPRRHRGPQITGEASPTYFDTALSDTIPRAIDAFSPNSTVFIITRDPLDRAVSHFAHLKTVNNDPMLKDMTADRFFAFDPAECLSQRDHLSFLRHQVLSFSMYSRKAMFFKEVFPPERLLFLDNTELRTSPRDVSQRVFSAMRLDSHYSDDFTEVRYSSGATVSDLDTATATRLRHFFSADYDVYRSLAFRK